jgi:hypothetical protein
MKIAIRLAGALAGTLTLLAASSSICAQELPPPGFLCCNLRTDGSWASDNNYQENGKKMLEAGTAVKPLSYGRYRVYIEINGAKQAIGNDYSRDLAPDAFARRWIVKDDPKVKLASWPPKIQEAVKAAKLMPGMAKEQVMAVGYPMSSENPTLDAPIWRYWLSSFAEFRVKFDERGIVKSIDTDEVTAQQVTMK